MKTNKEILDELGQIIVNDCFDPTYANLEGLKNKENPPVMFKEYSDLFKKLDKNDFKILKKYLKDSLGGLAFNFLRVFEENKQFKIHYENNEQKVNLVEISEDLKAEPIIEDGWISRFSKYIKDDEII